jgi:hypothetical protein
MFHAIAIAPDLGLAIGGPTAKVITEGFDVLLGDGHRDLVGGGITELPAIAREELGFPLKLLWAHQVDGAGEVDHRVVVRAETGRGPAPWVAPATGGAFLERLPALAPSSSSSAAAMPSTMNRP